MPATPQRPEYRARAEAERRGWRVLDGGRENPPPTSVVAGLELRRSSPRRRSRVLLRDDEPGSLPF